MKLTVQKILDATLVVSLIIRDQNGVPRPKGDPREGQIVPRPMPGRGRYRLVRLHSKLLPEFEIANRHRDDLIRTYDHHPVTQAEDGTEIVSELYSVPADKMEEFAAAWKPIADDEIEIDVQPIPADQLFVGNDTDGCITPIELTALGDLVTDA